MYIDTFLNIDKQKPKTKNSAIILSVSSNWTRSYILCRYLSLLGGQAMHEAVNNKKMMRSLSTNFIGPLEADSEFSISVEFIWEGKNERRMVIYR
jgi:hypothetical protein